MQITVSGKQLDLSDALCVRVSAHLENIATKYFGQAQEANVTFSRARSFFTCDINLHAGRGLRLRGEGEALDANTAFDDAAEHIAKRLRRYRRRVNEHARDLANRERPEEARRFVLERTEVDGDADGGNGAAADGALATVIAEHPTEISWLSLDEAVMQMDLADQPLLLFRNRVSGVLNVVYRRSDGNIGWIET
ncbi:MAG TPA: ribosome-associated translation inhibitor RaiA [Acetobacteraceae bacterium]|nr:ribosome-associated translation inhibitor RaiA [Acetobacteraceae bacterium]